MAYSPVRTNGTDVPGGDDMPQDELGQINLKMNQTTDEVCEYNFNRLATILKFLFSTFSL